MGGDRPAGDRVEKGQPEGQQKKKSPERFQAKTQASSRTLGPGGTRRVKSQAKPSECAFCGIAPVLPATPRLNSVTLF